MIGKLLNIPYQKIAKTVHGEMEQNKRRSSQKKSEKEDENENNEVVEDTTPIVLQADLESWIKELNNLECYIKNDLKFNLSFEGQHFIIKLIDKNGHILQEYLPIHFKVLYLQLKQDKADSQKGTILNLNC